MRRALVLVAPLTLLAACQQNEAPAAPASEAAEPLNAAQQAYTDANTRMHEGMAAIPADPDEAFMRGMLAHHRGAVEMAEIELEHGKDPEARALAESVIAAQQAEIEQMEEWLAARPAATWTLPGA